MSTALSLILHRGREFARESEQVAWKAVHVGVCRVEFLDVAVSRQWVSEPCRGRLPEDGSSA
jgi:hypothetical protein